MAVVSARAAVSQLRATADDGRLEALCVRVGVTFFALFGSAARPDGEPRDVDVAVSTRSGRLRPPLDGIALLQALFEMTGFEGFDVLDLDRAGVVAREQALVYGFPLYERVDGTYARLQMAAMGEWMDTDWMRRQELQLLANPTARRQ